MTTHSPSCLCAGTPISSNVFGPLPGLLEGFAGGFATAPAGFGVVEGEGSAGPSVRVTGFLPGTSALGAGGGRRRRAMEVEVRTAVCCDHHAERRSRCRRPVVVIVVVERKLMDLAVGSSRLEVQK